ncbi:MAG: tRNA (guanosine(37)-N1)-methyltransferase TrmD, partial [Candidatus Zixiibacteriota bacterium]
ESAMADSHSEKLLGAPVYTRPEEFMGLKIPDELISGNHKLIEEFRKKEAIKKTFKNRPEILDDIKNELSDEENKYIDKIRSGKNN